MRKVFFTLLVLVVVTSATACFHKQFIYSTFNLEEFESQQVESDDIPYSGQPIYIDNYIGKIVVLGQDEPDFAIGGQFVSVEAVMKVRDVPFEQLDLDISRDDDEIQISTSGPVDIGRRLKWTPPFVEDKMAYFELTIRVPQEAEIHIVQELGEIEVRGIGSDAGLGELEIEQFYGEIAVFDSQLEAMRIAQSYGDIYVLGSKLDNARLKTGIGDIQVQFGRDDSVRVEAKTGLREIFLEGVTDGDEGVLAVMDQSWPGQELKLLQWAGESIIELETRIGEILVQFLSEESEQSD